MLLIYKPYLPQTTKSFVGEQNGSKKEKTVLQT